MREFTVRTDLALEARESYGGRLDGVRSEESIREGLHCTRVTIENDAAGEKIGMAAGRYYTLNISSLLRRESEAFAASVKAVASVFEELFAPDDSERCTLVVGLGNRDITPDNVGPLASAQVLVTRHLKKEAPEDFKMLRPVAVITPGVLASSGIESADYIRWVCDRLSPRQVVTIDALAAASLDRLCRTVQVTDSGIRPGSGVGNTRSEISAATLGVPVVSIGVPTVVDIRNLLDEKNSVGNKSAAGQDMIVTPRNIDSEVVCEARLLAYALNCALHPGLQLEDIDMLVN